MKTCVKSHTSSPFVAMLVASSGAAVSADTDNTGESTTSYFGDIEFVGGAKR